jgi:hypothetical protein
MSITKPSGANGDFTLPETATWETGIYQLEANDDVIAGPGEIDNLQAMGLANRTLYLKQALTDLQIALGGIDLSLYAPKNNPALTGVPTAPTPSATDNSTQIATTAFVKEAVPMTKVSAQLLIGSAIALESNVFVNIASITLPAGIWIITANALFHGTSSPQHQGTAASITTVSATPETATIFRLNTSASGFISFDQTATVPPLIIDLVSTTTFYLVGGMTIYSGDWIGYGWINALKVK